MVTFVLTQNLDLSKFSKSDIWYKRRYIGGCIGRFVLYIKFYSNWQIWSGVETKCFKVRLKWFLKPVVFQLFQDTAQFKN